MVLRRIMAVLLGLMFASHASAQSHKQVSAFFYGNSLVNHVEGGAETTVPYWLFQLAEADGNWFAADGTFGFLRNFSANLPPQADWQIAGVPHVWNTRERAFRRAGFDTIVINPANFIQYQSAAVKYDGENERNESPLSATLRVINWTETNARGARFLIYEGWADMAGVVRKFPPNARGLARYQAFNQGDYHQWYVNYVDALRLEKPALEIGLIPVASVLGRVLSETDLKALDATDLYSDDAPHGTPTLYFLAAMVSYATLYAAPPPAGYVPPEVVHPLVREKYREIAASIWAAASGAAVPLQGAELAPETGLADPQLAMGLNGISDWSSQQPFVDIMKTARPWIGHVGDQWGGYEAAQLEAAGLVDADGWPKAIPQGVTRLEALILTDLPVGATSTSGRYRVRYEGQGKLTVVGNARDVSYGDHEIWFSFRPGPGGVALSLAATDAQDPIRNITVVRENQIALFEVGVVFNPDWIAHVRDLRSLRFMDWMFTNGSTVAHWEERAGLDDYSYVRRGVPLELMVRLSNEVGADPWFTMPHRADDAYISAFAHYVHDHLDPGLKAYVEYSNELWNFIFPQTLWVQEQARGRWGDRVGDDGWMQYAGLRAAEVMRIWQGIYGAESGARLVRVVATHTGWPGLEEPMLQAPLYVAEAAGNTPPAQEFDAYAVTGYFGLELGTDAFAPQVVKWIAAGTAEARVTETLRKGSLGELLHKLWPYHAGVAKRYGLDLVMYEGGTHVTGHEGWVDNDELTRFFTEFNYSPAIAGLYGELLAGWRTVGGTLFNAFVDVSVPSKWGSWGALRHNDDMNPRWATLMAYNAAPGPEWEARAAGSFDHGVTRWGSEGGDLLEGTPQEDVLIGLAGDDVLRAAGGNDRLHGGDGVDRAVLHGAAEDYALAWLGNQLVATGPSGEIVMVAVEELVFDANPDQVMQISAPD